MCDYSLDTTHVKFRADVEEMKMELFDCNVRTKTDGWKF